MKWSDEEIDKIAQQAASKVEVPYNDQYWSEMEALLDVNAPLTGETKSNRKGFWWLFGVFLALIGFAISFSLIQTNADSFDQRAQAKSKNSHDLNETQVQASRTEQDSNRESALVSGYTTAAVSENVDRNAKNAIQTKHVNQEANQEANENVREFETIALANQSKLNQQLASDGKTTKKAATNKIPFVTSSERKIKRNQKQMNPEFTEKQESTQKLNVPAENEKELSNRLVLNELNVGDQVTNQAEKEVLAQDKNGLNPEEKAENSSTNTEKEVADTTLSEQVEVEKRDALATVSVDTVKQPAVQPISIDLESIQQKIKQAVPTPSYYLQAGMRFSQSGLKTATNQLMTSVNIGFGYQYIKPGLGYSIGLHLTSSFVQNMEITRKSRVYGLSVVNHQQDLSYQQLTYLELPIQLNFMQIRNTFSLGISPTYLASTMMRFTERQESVITNEHHYYGQKIGFKSLGLDLNVGYQRAIKNNWSVGVQLGVSLVQQIEKNQFEAESVAFPVYGQIALRKTLIRKK